MNRNIFLIALAIIWAAGCSSSPRIKQTPQASKPASAPVVRGGGYYLDDGPGDNPPPNLLAIPDAVPRAEPLHRYANRPYEALGAKYIPMMEIGAYQKEGVASWYGRRYHGKPTASGEIYDMYGMTAAHPTLPIPSYVRVTALGSGKSVVVRVNDRGPFHSDRIIDLSYTAAYKLGVVGNGSGRVQVESLGTQSTRAMSRNGTLAAGGFFVQLGVFGQPDNAEKLLQRARDTLGIAPELSRVAMVGGMHRVSLGPFTSEDEAGGWAEKSRLALGLEPAKVRY